ncbi:MAG TPA: PAS domain S-box protein [Anaerolineales bacterium]|nr:PAS domain S-box protein [Anaerolineales bacterium]
MPRKNKNQPENINNSNSTRTYSEETEETLQAIRQDMVDALLVTRGNGTRVVTFNDADFPYRLMVESMSEGAVTLIPDGTIFYSNSRFCEMVQTESDLLVGTPFREFIMPEEREAFDTIFSQASLPEARGEFCLKEKAGTCVPVQLSLYPLKKDAVIGISIIITDLTERKRAEEALQKSESLFRLIATNSPDVIFAQDRNLRYTWIVNTVPPLPQEEVIGKRDADLMPIDQALQLTELKQKILKTGISVRQELMLSPSGSQRWFDAIYQPLYDHTQQIVGIVCYARDITEHIHAEEKIRTLAAKLTVAEQEERQRISQVLHDDLQQRLFAIKAQLSFLNGSDQKHEPSPSPYFSFDEIQSALSEAIAVTRNLSIDISPMILHGEGLTESMKWLSSRMTEQYGLQVQINPKENVDQLDHHVRLVLFQAVRELLFNIVKHAGTSQATITIEQEHPNARVIISDTGKGFDVEAIMKDPQASHGLLMVQDRLGLLGCTMKIISKPGNGTRVILEAPLEKISE